MSDEVKGPESGARQSGRFDGGGAVAVSGRSGGKGSGEDEARTAGRGFVFITGAKLWFMVMGAIVNLGLPAVMAPADFGVYSVVINAVSLINMVVITGTLQAVAKLVSERPADASRIAGRAAALQWMVGVPLGLAYIFGADVIAGWLSDPALRGFIQISGGVILAYGFYAIAVGVLNGMKAFGRQAALDVAFSTLKTGLIMGAVFAGLGVMGAVWGFVAAAVGVTLVSGVVLLLFLRRHPAPEAPEPEESKAQLRADMKKLLVYLLLIMLYTFCVNGVLRADLFLLKSLVGAAEGGGTNLANELAGIYTAMLNVSRLPYQAVIAVTFVIFPMISRATFEADLAATQAYIRGAMRYSLILLGLLSVLLAGNAQDVVLTLYGDKYASGAVPLMVLSLATVGFALFFIATTMITGAGKPMVSVLVAAGTLAITVALNYVLLGSSIAEGIDPDGLVMLASSATAVAMLCGFALSVSYLVWKFKAGLPMATLARVGVASAVVLGLMLLAVAPEEMGRLARLGALVGKGIAGSAIFLALLWFSREFGDEDKDRLRRALRRKRG